MLVFAAVFALFAGYFGWHEYGWWPALVAPAAAFLILALARPTLLVGPTGNGQPSDCCLEPSWPIVMGPVYFATFSPNGLIARLVGWQRSDPWPRACSAPSCPACRGRARPGSGFRSCVAKLWRRECRLMRFLMPQGLLALATRSDGTSSVRATRPGLVSMHLSELLNFANPVHRTRPQDRHVRANANRQ